MTSTGVVLDWLAVRENLHPNRSGRVRHHTTPPGPPQISRSQPVHQTLPRPCPLALNSFEGNKAEKASMVPTIQEFKKAHSLCDLTIVADAGMISAANMQDIENECLSFILGARTPDLPYQVRKWQKDNPGKAFEDGQIFVQPWPAGAADKRRDQMIYHQYRADRARRTLRGIDEQVAKAKSAVEGKVPVNKNRFVKLLAAPKA